MLFAFRYTFLCQREERGGIAQLGERLHGMQEVRGSIPLVSTISTFTDAREILHPFFCNKYPPAMRVDIYCKKTHRCAMRISPMVRLGGFEPSTHGLEGRCSIQLSYRCMVGMTGFEPATSCSQSKRATKLRYIPIPHYYNEQLGKSQLIILRYAFPRESAAANNRWRVHRCVRPCS